MMVWGVDWVYSDYEGLLSSEIKEKNAKWEIWRDGYVLNYFIAFTDEFGNLAAQEEKALNRCKLV